MRGQVADDERAVRATRQQLVVVGEVDLIDSRVKAAYERRLGMFVVVGLNGLERFHVPDFDVALAGARGHVEVVRVDGHGLDRRLVGGQLLQLLVRAHVVDVDLALSVAAEGQMVQWRVGGASATRNVRLFVSCL